MTTHDIDPTTREALALLVMPYLLGVIFNWALLGCLTVQAYLYSISSNGDGMGLKTLVYGVYVVDAAQTAIGTYNASVVLVWGPAGYAHRSDFIWSISLVQILAGVVPCLVQCFSARRIWLLKNTRTMSALVVCIVALSIAQGAAAIVNASQAFVRTNVPFIKEIEAPIIWLSLSFLCDVLIAGSLLHLLKEARAQTPFKATHTLLTRIIAVTVQTGCVTAVAAGLQLAAVLLDFAQTTQYSEMFAFVLATLYANVLMATLNARTALVRAVDDGVNTVALKSGEGVAFRLQLTEPGVSDGSLRGGEHTPVTVVAPV
ncbi:hypothetical protein PLICRDRAFT_177697 [Plicaturopsis crispa FD-325 SS-3]|nr:hypothetical protein PLICRDRAFT_177697 [Plicaturopsis crispa FD-325 SS-3]